MNKACSQTVMWPELNWGQCRLCDSRGMDPQSALGEDGVPERVGTLGQRQSNLLGFYSCNDNTWS